MPFSKEIVITKITAISLDQTTSVTVEGVLFWKNEMKQTSQGSKFKEGILKDDTDEILITLIESLDKETWYVITYLKVKQNHGLKLQHQKYHCGKTRKIVTV